MTGPPTFTAEGRFTVRLDIDAWSHRYVRAGGVWILEESCRDGIRLPRASRSWDPNDPTTTGLEDLPAKLDAALAAWDPAPCRACGLPFGVDGLVIFDNEADRAESVHEACAAMEVTGE